MGFSDAVWGKAMHGFATLIHLLSNTNFNAIITAAQAFTKPTHAHNRTSSAEVIDVDADTNEQEGLIENPATQILTWSVMYLFFSSPLPVASLLM